MSLKLYALERDVPSGIRIVDSEMLSIYMTSVVLRDTVEVRAILKHVDNAEYASKYTFKSNKWPQMGETNYLNLSSGCKTALVIQEASDKLGICVNPLLVGNTAWSAILAHCTSGSVLYVPKIWKLSNDVRCDVIFNGKHYGTIGELSDDSYKYVKEFG